jgi:SpoVK/Ycf46/Vps4 family AAA+-type ATPase
LTTFGRQQDSPARLAEPLDCADGEECGFLSLHTGRKLEVPFAVLIVFSTNLPPRDLVDEAFLRRIRHKIEITSPSLKALPRDFPAGVRARKIPYDEQAVRYLLQEYYVKKNRKLRANHPRD